MKLPKVSVLVPVYNRENFIALCIESALSQTFTDLEVIVVDNASTDRTWDICKHYAGIDSRVRIFRNEENLGPVRNWLRCASEAQGEYGKILFSDDLMFPQFLEHTLPYLKDPDVAFVSTAVLVGKTQNEGAVHFGDMGNGKLSCERYFEGMIDKQVTYSPGAGLFRMSDIRENMRLSFPTKYQRDFAKNGAGPDVLLYALTALNYKYVALLSGVDAFFRVHSGSFTIANHDDEVRQNYHAAIAWFCKNKLSIAYWARHVARIWLSDMKANRRLISPRRYCDMYDGGEGRTELLTVLMQSYHVIVSGGRSEVMPLPNLVIAGAPKSGTTSLFQWFAAHPSVVTSRVKETYYLMDSGYPLFKEGANYLTGGLSGYSKFFPTYKSGQLCIEATPDYMYQKAALKVLSELPTQPTIVFILRNPVDRVLSLFRFAKNNVGSLDPDISVSEFINTARNGTLSKDKILNGALLHSEYHAWLGAWIQACGKSRIKVLFFEDMVNDPLTFMEGLCTLMEIDGKFYKQFVFKPENQSRQIRSIKLLYVKNFFYSVVPFMSKFWFMKSIYRMVNVNTENEKQEYDAATVNALHEYFAEPNRKLSLLLDKELPATWKN